ISGRGPTVCSLDLSPESRATAAACPFPRLRGGKDAASRAAGRPLPPPAGEGWDGGTLRRGTGCHRDPRQGAPPRPPPPRAGEGEGPRRVRPAGAAPRLGGRAGRGPRSGAEPVAIATCGRLPPTPAPSPARGGGRGAASGAASRLLPPPAGECRDGGAVRLPGQGGAVR